MRYITVFLAGLLMGAACTRPAHLNKTPEIQAARTPQEDRLSRALNAAEIPADMQKNILANRALFLEELSGVLDAETYRNDPFLYLLVDKKHPLVPQDYFPDDLVELSEQGAFGIGREGLLLRYPAAAALEKMAKAALRDGVTLVASSTFRPYDYQIKVYERNVRENGQAAADRVSARPGYSQHQLGLVVDFGSITDAFADTKAGKWMAENAAGYGWSLSFPAGYEAVTGYRWESWHYRYTGRPLTRLIERWFGGIQQYTLQFINCWQASAA